MKIKKLIGALLFLALLTACSKNTEKDRVEPDLPADTPQITEPEKKGPENNEPDNDEPQNSEPEDNDELFNFIMEKWKTGDTQALHPYLSDEILSLCDSGTFSYMFESITDTFGEIVTNDEPEITSAGGIDVYSAAVHLEHADVDIRLSLKDTKIYGFARDIRFNGEFDVTTTGIREHYFQLNGLNAVYTCAEGSESAPAVLMISGSGPSDYNATVGILCPMEDLALRLAEYGISSLRFEKRTFRFPGEFQATDGIEEEYLKDCRNALSYLKEQHNTDGLYLLGHSLGGQIAAALAAEDDSVDGMILLMSTARHLADICYDQYTAIQPSGAEEFAKHRDAARAQSGDTASGQYSYFGMTDAYWASYNTLNTIDSVRIAAIPTAIINSTSDNQIFTADISLWTESFANDQNVTLTVFEDMSHFGYKIDTRDQSQLYKPAEMPAELIDIIVQTINRDD